jgi:hypothetical protein
VRLCAVIGVFLAGCYHPTVESGVPCDENGTCPSGQRCIVGRCLAGDLEVDSGLPPDIEVTPDARELDAAIDATVQHVWSTPPVTLVELDSAGSEADPTMTANRLTVVWSSTRAGGLGQHDLWIATRAAVTDPFSGITDLTVLNSTVNDQAPEISPDGKTLYFASARSGNNDFYMSTFDGTAWAAPTPVAELNTTGSELELAVSPDLKTVVIDRAHVFYRATRDTTTAPFGTLVALPELQLSTDVASPTLGDGGGVIYFHAGAVRDMYVARETMPGKYGTPAPVTELNTADRDADPHINGAETFMVFNCGTSICTTTRN